MKFVPDFAYDETSTNFRMFVLRDLVPAGLLLGRIEDGTFTVHLDYVVPQYRDTKVARYLFFDCVDCFRERGVREIVSPGGAAEHRRYLRRMGFAPVGDSGNYRLALD